MAVWGLLQTYQFGVDDRAEKYVGRGEAVNQAFGRWDELRRLSWGLGIQHELQWTPQT
jgi:hypothetical protein